jgi:hypothetical protein
VGRRRLIRDRKKGEDKDNRGDDVFVHEELRKFGKSGSLGKVRRCRKILLERRLTSLGWDLPQL